MAASYDLTGVPGAHKKRRRLALRLPSIPRPRLSGFGGGLGLVIVALGLIAIGIGWNGMAGGGGQINGASDLRAQLPWLVSGGVLGLALVVLGGAMLIVHNARIDRSRLEAKLDDLVNVIARGGLSNAPAYPSASTAGLFAAGGTSYHEPSCRLVEGRDEITFLTPEQVEERGLRACRVCQPASVETLSS